MGNYFTGDLHLHIDPNKISFYNLIHKVRDNINEHLSYILQFPFSTDYLDSKGFDIEDFYKYRYAKYSLWDIEGGSEIDYEELSDRDKEVENFLKFINFPIDILAPYDYFINPIENDEYDKYVDDQMVIDVDALSDKDIIHNYYIKIQCCTKYYKDTDCEQSILDVIEALRPYRKITKGIDSVGNNNIGTIKDEDYTYNRNFVWDKELLEREYMRRSYLCNGCEADRGKYDLCGKFVFCERAYNLCFQQYCMNNSVLEDE